MDKDRIRKICKWADEYSDGYVGDIATNEIRALLDMADDRDRYRALLMAAASHMPPNKAETRGLRKRIDAALEGKNND